VRLDLGRKNGADARAPERYAGTLHWDGQRIVDPAGRSRVEHRWMSRTAVFEAARLHEILDAVPHKIWMVRPQGMALYYNRATRDYVGDTLELDRPSRDRQMFHPEDLPRLAAARVTALEEGRDFTLDLRLRRKDGVWRWHRLDVFLLRSRSEIDAWVVTATDFDDLKRAVQSAERAGEDLRLAAEAGQLGIYSFDRETREHAWSPGLRQIFGLAPDAPVPAAVLPLVHPDDRERVKAGMKASLDAAGSGVFQDEHRILRADGSVRWVLAKGKVTFVGGGGGRKAKHGVGCVLDITERKLAETALAQSEERYRTLVESATDIIATLDLDGRFVTINPAVERILGYAPEDMIGKKIEDFVQPELVPMQDAMLKRRLEGETSTQYELEVVAKDGGRRIILDIKSRLALGDDGKPLAIHSIARDITERKEADARQTVLLRELQHRTKNMLAVIQSIVTNTLRKSRDLASAEEALVGRLHALAHAQEFVASGPGGGAPLRQLIDAELLPFAARATVSGEMLVVGGAFAQTFALLVHELATNASKYGALSSPRGRVVINWKVEDGEGGPDLRFAWVERGGPPALPPKETGLGTILMSAIGQSQAAFNEDGFEYVLTVPLAEAMRGRD
jgi:PAS domain S-box-containing protein